MADVDDSPDTDTNYHYLLQKRLEQFALKHREIQHISKFAMESIVSDVRDIMIICQNAFAQSLVNTVPSSSNFQIDNAVDNCELLLNDIFNTVKSAKQLKRFCVQHMQMILPTEFTLHMSFHYNKRVRASFCYVSILESLRIFVPSRCWRRGNQKCKKAA